MKVRKKNVCHTCRRRKLGCDGKRPACSQCLSSRRHCEGYPGVLFVQAASAPGTQGLRTSHVAHLSKLSPQRPAHGLSTSTSEPPPTHAPAHGKATQVNVASSSDLSSSGSLAYRQADLSYYCPFLPSLPSNLQETISLILRNFVPHCEVGRDITNALPQSPRICGSWVTALPELSAGSTGSSGECLGSAMNALALSIMANRTGRKLLPCISSCYERTLTLLQHDLRLTGGTYKNEQVATIMCLALLEVLSPIKPGSWLVHVDGVGELIRSSSPELFSDGLQHKLFIGFRPLLILKAFIARKGTFFADEDWVQRPFQRHPASPLQSLLSLAASFPAILERFDSLSEEPSNTVIAVAEQRLAELMQMRANLASWCSSFIAESSVPLYWTRTSEEPSKCSHNLLWFQHLSVANVFTYLWSFQIISLSHIQSLLAQFPCLEGLTTAILADATGRRDVCIYLSIKIFQSMEYLLQPEFMLYGLSSASFPLFTACTSLESDEQGRAILRGLDKTVIDRNIVDRVPFPSWMSTQGQTMEHRIAAVSEPEV